MLVCCECEWNIWAGDWLRLFKVRSFVIYSCECECVI
jgi:hypothetical protein